MYLLRNEEIESLAFIIPYVLRSGFFMSFGQSFLRDM